MDKLLNVKEASEVLRQPVHTLYHWRAVGKGPKSARIGARVFYREHEVRAWLDAQFGDDGKLA